MLRGLILQPIISNNYLACLSRATAEREIAASMSTGVNDEAVCPKCRQATLSVSERTYFYECQNCGWKGLQPTFTRPLKQVPLRRNIAGVILLVVVAISFAAISAFLRISVGVMDLAVVFALLIAFPFYERFLLDTPRTKWKLGKMTDAEIDLLRSDDLAMIYEESLKYVKDFRRIWIIAGCVLLSLVILAVAFDSDILGGLALIFGLFNGIYFPFWFSRTKKVRDLIRRVELRTARNEASP